MSITAPGHTFQYAWVVPDMAKAADYWGKIVGIGPFYVTEVDSSTMEGFSYRGGDGDLKMRVGWAQGKEGQIELIEVLSESPNVYHDLVPPGKTQFHHVGIWSDDYDADCAFLKAQGFEMAMELNTGSMISYFDTSAANGAMLEVITRNEGTEGLFAMIAQAAQDWDGDRPVREVAELFG